MADFHDKITTRVTWIIIAVLLAGTTIATAFLFELGDWERHAGALTLSLRILWGSALVGCVASALTRLTIFGWSFRNWFRPIPRIGVLEPPWPKSGAASFAVTFSLVALLGAACVASTVLWILRDALGEWLLGLILKIIWGAWWVLCIAAVLTRVALFRQGMVRAAPGPPRGRRRGGAGHLRRTRRAAQGDQRGASGRRTMTGEDARLRDTLTMLRGLGVEVRNVEEVRALAEDMQAERRRKEVQAICIVGIAVPFGTATLSTLFMVVLSSPPGQTQVHDPSPAVLAVIGAIWILASAVALVIVQRCLAALTKLRPASPPPERPPAPPASGRAGEGLLVMPAVPKPRAE